MDFQLTSGSCEQLQLTAPDDSPLTEAPHILQILGLKEVSNANTKRYRMLLSDGAYYIQSMLSTALNPDVENGRVQKHGIVIVSQVRFANVLNHPR